MASSISEALSALTASPGLLSASRSHFGSSKAMAAALGVTPRTVQRWFTSGKERRAPQPASRAKLLRALPIQARIQGRFYFDSPGKPARGKPSDTRQRDITFALSAEDLARIQSAEDAEEAREALFEAYGMGAPDDVIGADYSFSIGR